MIDDGGKTMAYSYLNAIVARYQHLMQIAANNEHNEDNNDNSHILNANNETTNDYESAALKRIHVLEG